MGFFVFLPSFSVFINVRWTEYVMVQAMKASVGFTIVSWEEKPFAEIEGATRLTHANVHYAYKGGLEGDGFVAYLMHYDKESVATYSGYERVVGSLGGRTGSFVMQHSGTYRDGVARTVLTIVSGSGSGELADIRGTAAFVSGHADEYVLMLEYELE